MTHVPLVAYRGLWDKFAPPGSVAAMRRAYLRGVACVLQDDKCAPPIEVMRAIVGDPTVNRRRLPLYRAAASIKGIAELSRLRDGGWEPCGVYVSASVSDALKPGLERAAHLFSTPIVLVESANVLNGASRMATPQDPERDIDVLTRALALVPVGADVSLVSDLVELDQLRRQQDVS